MILRWLVPFMLAALLWLMLVGVWAHDWRVIVGAIAAFVGVLVAEVES